MLGGQKLDGLSHFAQHALGRNAQARRMHGLRMVSSSTDGKLRQPRRGVLLQHLDTPPAVVARQPAQRLQNRHVRLTFAVVVLAVAARDTSRRDTAIWLDEGAHESGLADAGLAGDQSHLPRSEACLFEGRSELRKLFFAFDKAGRSPRLRVRRPPGECCTAFHRHDEPIALPRHGFDILLPVCDLPRALRIAETLWSRLFSSTTLSGHTAFISSSLRTRWLWFSTSTRRVSNILPRRGTISFPSQESPLADIEAEGTEAIAEIRHPNPPSSAVSIGLQIRRSANRGE